MIYRFQPLAVADSYTEDWNCKQAGVTLVTSDAVQPEV